MNSKTSSLALQDRFGRLIAARLSAGCDAIDQDIGERLRVARQQAVARRKPEAVFAVARVAVQGGGASLQLGGPETGWWGRLATAVPLLVLAAGLLTIHVLQTEDRANELADIDAALLTDTLPTAAYTDPGFVQFLKSELSAAPRD